MYICKDGTGSDDAKLTGKVHGASRALTLISPRNLKDTLTSAEKGGIVCLTGLPGGVYTLNGFNPIKDIKSSRQKARR